MTASNLQQIPASDADGDITNLGDLLGGSGATDPNEGGETDEQLINVGGQGEDLRAFQALHNPNYAPTRNPGEANALVESVAGSLPQGSSSTLELFVAAVAFQAANNSVTQNQTLQDTQTDPLDPSYNQVFSPVFNPVSALPALPASLSVTEAAMLQSDATTLLTDEGKVSSYAQAIYVTQNRLLSSYQVGDLSSANMQNSALNQYVAALAASETAQGQAQTVFGTDLTITGAVLPITAADVTALQSELKLQGLGALPAQEQAAIRSDFPNPADQQAIVNGPIQADPTLAPNSFAAALQDESTNSTNIGETLTISPLTNLNVPPLNSGIPADPIAQTVQSLDGPEFGNVGDTLAHSGIIPQSVAGTTNLGTILTWTAAYNEQVIQFLQSPGSAEVASFLQSAGAVTASVAIVDGINGIIGDVERVHALVDTRQDASSAYEKLWGDFGATAASVFNLTAVLDNPAASAFLNGTAATWGRLASQAIYGVEQNTQAGYNVFVAKGGESNGCSSRFNAIYVQWRLAIIAEL